MANESGAVAQQEQQKAVKVYDPKTSVWAREAQRQGLTHTSCREIVLATVMPRRDGKLIGTEADMSAALLLAEKYVLDPFKREIFFTPAKGGGILSLVGVDGWVTLANRQPDYDGWTYEEHLDASGALESVSVSVHFKNRKYPCTVKERLKECRRNTDPWRDMPHRMLRNRALCQAIRTAFGIGGVYLPDEAEDMIETEATTVASRPLSSTEGLATRLAERASAVRQTTPTRVELDSPALDQDLAARNAELDRQIADEQAQSEAAG